MQTCCDAFDGATATTCTTCDAAVCGNCRSLVNGKVVCGDCRGQIEREIARERAGTASIVPAFMGGIAGALLGGTAWAIVAIVAKLELAYVAIFVGWLAGQGVYRGAGRRRGPSLQVAAVICSVFGLLMGRYFTYAAIERANIENGADPSELSDFGYFSANMMERFRLDSSDLVSGFDLLWIAFAIAVAWGIPKATDVRIDRSR